MVKTFVEDKQQAIDEVFVVDIETTTKKGDPNIAGYPVDKVLEIGICKINLQSGVITHIWVILNPLY